MRSSGIQLRVSDLLFAIQKRWRIILALTFVGLLFGLLLSGMTYIQATLQSYSISGSFAITTRDGEGRYLGGMQYPAQSDFTLPETMGDAVIYVMRSDASLSQVINDCELLGVNATDIRGALNIRQYNGTQILEMTLSWQSDEEGLAIWNEIIETANELLPDTLQFGQLAIINPPQSRLNATGASGMSLWIFLAGLGFMAGLGFAVMELLMHPTLTNVKDAESMFGLETLGMIPRDNAYFRGLTSMLTESSAGTSEVVQNYSAVAYIIRNRLGVRDKHHCFYVTSAIKREGRSTVAAELAVQFSDMEHRTLLIDFDMRNPSLGTLFMNNVDYNHSLNALYRGDINESEAITHLTGYLDILPMVLEHNTVPIDNMIVDLVERLKQNYEYVIMDAPPVGTESDTLSLNQLANTVLFVLGYDQATIPEIQAALEKLDKSGMRVLGCVINGVQSNLFKGQNEKDKKKPSRGQRRKKTLAEEKFGDIKVGDQAEDKPVEGLLNVSAKPAPEESARDGKRRNKLFGKKTGEEAVSDEPAAQPAAERRNVLDDLANEASDSGDKSDQDAMDMLIRMGLEEKQDGASEDERG